MNIELQSINEDSVMCQWGPSNGYTNRSSCVRTTSLYIAASCLIMCAGTLNFEGDLNENRLPRRVVTVMYT